MNSKFTNVLRGKSGVALMTVVLIFLVLVLLLTGVMARTIVNLNGAETVRRNTSSFYAAESGINLLTGELQAIKDDTTLTNNQTYVKLIEFRDKYIDHEIDMNDSMGEDVVVNVKLEDFEIDDKKGTLSLKIVSEGHVGENKRTLFSEIEFDYHNTVIGGDSNDTMKVTHAVFVKNTIVTGNGVITSVNPSDPNKYPKIASLSTTTNSINLNKGLQFPNGEIELVDPKPNCSNNLVVSTDFRCYVNETRLVEEDREVTPPEKRVNFPSINFGPIRTKVSSILLSKDNLTTVSKIGDTLTNSTFKKGNYLISHVDFSTLNNKTLTINAGEEVFIITNKLTLGTVKIVGEGKITIYVNPGQENFVSSNDKKNGVIFGRVDNEDKLIIIVDTMSGVKDNEYHVNFMNNSVTGAHFMFENARIQFNQNSRLNGAVYTSAANGSVSAVNLENNANISEGEGRALIVATNGRVNMENNSSLSGAVIANDFKLGNGGSIIRFDPDLFQKIPLEIIEPLQNGNDEESKTKQLKIGPTIEG